MIRVHDEAYSTQAVQKDKLLDGFLFANDFHTNTGVTHIFTQMFNLENLPPRQRISSGYYP